MRVETIGSTPMLYIKTHANFGGPGSLHLFSLYSVNNGKLVLLKQYEHDRMEQTYFCLKKKAIYDAVLVKTRGPKHGNAYIYTCYLAVSKYSYDGSTFVKVGTENLREMKGNRFLDEKYWFLSVCKALDRGEVFQSDFVTKR